jgi:hypothetical protein
MEMRHISSAVRLAEIVNVNYSDGIAHTRWLDEGGEVGPIIPIPHPAANKGGSGIFVGIKIGTIVALNMASYERYIPVSIIPIRAYYNLDISDAPEADFDDLSFPTIESGEIVIHGPTGAQIKLGAEDKPEEIIIDNEFNEGVTIR